MVGFVMARGMSALATNARWLHIPFGASRWAGFIARGRAHLAYGLAVVLLLLGAGPAFAGTPRESPAVSSMAADAYVKAHGVSWEEALRRLDIQDRAASVVDPLADALGPAYGDVWFDALDGGRLKVGVALTPGVATDSNVARAQGILAEAGLASEADLVGVHSGVNSLVSAHTDLDRDLWTFIGSGDVSTAVDTSRNLIVIDTSTSLSAADRAAIEAAAQRASVQTSIEESDQAKLFATQEACSFGGVSWDALYCDSPLRGGVRINTPAPYTCTAGFMAIDRRSPYPWRVLTAGHCLEDDPHVWQSRTTSGSTHDIGARLRWQNGPEADAGVFPIPSSSFFEPVASVVVGASANTTVDTDYEIIATRLSSVGMTICRTSGTKMDTGYWSGCGEVTGLDRTVTYDDGTTVRHLGEACIDGSPLGSSGGPYFKHHDAYGIHSGAKNVGCIVYYQGVRGAEDAMRVNILLETAY